MPAMIVPKRRGTPQAGNVGVPFASSSANVEKMERQWNLEQYLIDFLVVAPKSPRTRPGAASFGERTPGITPRGQALLAVFRQAGWRVELLENMTGMLWKKFAYLSGSAGVCAASGCAYGELRGVPETRAVIRDAIAEALAVGAAAGAPLEPDSLEWSMQALDNFPATGMASLAKDFAEGRPVELEGLTGTVIRMGRQHGVPTPINDALYAVLKPRANRIAAGLAAGA